MKYTRFRSVEAADGRSRFGWKRALFAYGVLSLVILGWTGCSSSPSKAEPLAASGSASEPAVVATNVRVEALTPERLEETFSLIGETFAERGVTLSAETAGRLESLKVDLGDAVRKGQVLARVDYRLLKARVDQAEADHVLAHKTLDRMKHLRDRKAVAQQSVDEAIARDHLAEASLRLAQAQLSKSTIRAPVSGVVVGKRVDAGEYVNPGQPILDVTDMTSVKVRAQAPASLVDRLETGLPVRVQLPALAEAFEGRIELVVPVASGTSRTFEIRIELLDASRKIPVGLDARLAIRAQVYPDALVVPQGVVLQRGTGQLVFVADGAQAVRRVVTLGPVSGQRVLVRSGLNPGDLLIVDGHRDLVDGQPIQVVD